MPALGQPTRSFPGAKPRAMPRPATGPTAGIQAPRNQVPKLVRGQALAWPTAIAGLRDDWRQRDQAGVPRVLQGRGPRGRAVVAARAAQRSVADVHQRRHGAVQERLHRPGDAALRRAPRPRRSASAPAASTTTSTTSATPRATTRSSRCSATSRSATTSRSAPSSSPGICITKDFGLDKKRLTVTVYHEDDEALRHLEEAHRLRRRPDHPHRHQGQLLADGRHGPLRPLHRDLLRPRRQDPGRPSGLARRRRRPLHRDLESRLHAVRAARPRVSASTCRSRPSIPAWASSASPPCCRARTTTTRSTCSATSSRPSATRAASSAPVTIREGVDVKPARRVIADHLRATSFLIADGVLPSNEGRGYVLRRIMRRAMRYAHQLGCVDPLMYRLVPALVREMGAAYPELGRAEALITETLKLEETRFKNTLGNGLKLLGEASSRSRQGRDLPGRRRLQALRHLRLPARPDRGRAARARHRRRHQGLRRRHGEAEGRSAPCLEGLGRSRDRRDLVRDQGRDRRHRVPGLRHRGGRRRDPRAGSGRQARQVAQGRRRGRAHPQPDAVLWRKRRSGRRPGLIRGAKGALFRVTDTQKKLGDLFVHLGHVEKGSFKSGEAVELEVDHARRTATRANHSATHLAARGAAPGARAARGAEGLARLARSPALRLRAPEADERRGDRRGRGDRQRHRARRTARSRRA